jgi:hypothetical protein
MNRHRAGSLAFAFSMLLQKNLKLLHLPQQRGLRCRKSPGLLVFISAPSGRIISHKLRAILIRRRRHEKIPFQIQSLKNLHRNGMKFA